MKRLWLPLAVAALLPVLLGDAPPAPVPVDEAAGRMTVPDGFQVSLFAGEPDVVQPIAFTFDDRGRLWVVECFSYPSWEMKGGPGKDRILIFEDSDGDGKFDSRKVFWDQGVNLSGIEFGFGGVWLTAIPNLLFIPDRNGDDTPDAPPEVVLDGWSMNARHNVVNGLTWGPDGWLYGCNGILSESRIGKPGTPDDQRTAIDCGVWRYHPTGKSFEAVASGSTNPWGLDFDDYGEMFITNCVIKHLFHVIPGAHYQRMFGQDLTPHVYELMESCADHIHWAGGAWQESRTGEAHKKSGGGHAHAGAMVYLGDNWPDRYRNGLFTCNIHGNRVNHDTLERHESGYVAHHAPDFLFANDSWFRGLELQYGPDGGVYLTDWSDTGECHDREDIHRENGRIFKVTYGQPAHVVVDLGKLSDEELARLQLHRNDWQVRHARRLLQERAHTRKIAPAAVAKLREILQSQTDVTRQLRGLWALQAIGAVDDPLLTALLGHPQKELRAWAVRLAAEDRKVPAEQLNRFVELASKDPAPVVRLALASALQRLPMEARWALAGGLVTRQEDSADANIPLMVWYGIEPLVASNPVQALTLLGKTKLSQVRQFSARRLATLAGKETAQLGPLVQLLQQHPEPDFQRDVLEGLQQALEGLREAPMPTGWSDIYTALSRSPNAEVRERALVLSLVFGDQQAIDSLRKLAADVRQPAAARASALHSLLQRKDPDLVVLLRTLLDDDALRGPAIRGLAVYNEADTPKLILARYAKLNDSERQDAIQTLTSRPAYALEYLAAMEQGAVSRRDLSAFYARQLVQLDHKEVRETLKRVWGEIQPASKIKVQQLAKFKQLLTAAKLKTSDRSNGRRLFTQTCATCHVLFGEGAKIGPELTGAQRSNLDYLLENLLDPSSMMARDYQMTLIETTEGRVVTGILLQENQNGVVIQTATDRTVIPREEIEFRKLSPVSMMPEGILDKLSEQEVCDLVGYLSGAEQAPLPGG